MGPIDEVDLLLHDAPPAVIDSWRIVRAHLRRRKAPSRTDLEIDQEDTKPSIPSATAHFRAATSIARKAGE